MSRSAAMKLENEFAQLNETGKSGSSTMMIKEIAVLEVSRRKNNKPDCFTAPIKSIGINLLSTKML